MKAEVAKYLRVLKKNRGFAEGYDDISLAIKISAGSMLGR